MESFWMKSRHLKTRPVLKFPQKNKRLSVAWPLKFTLLKSNAVCSWRVLNIFSLKKKEKEKSVLYIYIYCPTKANDLKSLECGTEKNDFKDF